MPVSTRISHHSSLRSAHRVSAPHPIITVLFAGPRPLTEFRGYVDLRAIDEPLLFAVPGRVRARRQYAERRRNSVRSTERSSACPEAMIIIAGGALVGGDD